MTLNELRYFILLAQERHFGRAAKKAFVSQPALSIAIKNLEQSLNVRLFERNHNDILITKMGRLALEKAQLIVHECDQLRDMMRFANKPLEGMMKVGVIPTVAPYLMPKVILMLKTEAPQMSLNLYENTTDELVNMLQHAEIDVAIMALPIPYDGFKFIPLYEEPFVVVVPNEHVLLQQDSVGADQIYQYDPILLSIGHCFRDQVLEQCPELNAQDAQIKNSLETIKNMVASGISISVIPASALSFNYDTELIKVIPFSEPIPSRKLALVFRSSYTRIEAVRLLATAIKNTMPEYTDRLVKPSATQ